MLKEIQKFSKLDANLNLSAEYQVHAIRVIKNYERELTKKFKGHKRLLFSKACLITKPKIIEQGSLCYGSIHNGVIRFFISDKPIDNNTISHVIAIKDKRFTPDYLIWYLNYPFIKEYLSLHTVGVLINTIPDFAFNNLEIPIPKVHTTYNIKTTDINIENNGIRKLIKNYHKEYRDNINRLNYMAAAILAGAIGECILYNYLLEQDVEEKLLAGKTFGQLLDFVKVLGKADSQFPLIHFDALQTLRNDAVHPSRAKRNVESEVSIELRDFACFNNIIKYFGL